MSLDDSYILDENHQPRQVGWDEYLEWSKRGFDQTKRVAQTEVGDVRVSTVFLTIDHSFTGPPPILFETMVFGGDHVEGQWRYSSWDAAVAGHEAIVAALQNGTELPE